MNDYWQKQGDKPLFPDLLWARPEHSAAAGKLLVVGGTKQEFASPAQAYQAAQKAGAGNVRVLMPDALARMVGKLFPGALFVPSTPSGSFAVKSLAELMAESSWSDAVYVCSDIGNNSETIVLFEKFTDKYSGMLAISGNLALQLTKSNQLTPLRRENILCYASFDELQKLAQLLELPYAFTSDMGALKLAENLHLFSKEFGASLLVEYESSLFVAVDGRVSSTASSLGLIQASVATITWRLQNPSKPFESLTTALYE